MAMAPWAIPILTRRRKVWVSESAFYSHRYVQLLTRVVVLNGGMNILEADKQPARYASILGN